MNSGCTGWVHDFTLSSMCAGAADRLEIFNHHATQGAAVPVEREIGTGRCQSCSAGLEARGGLRQKDEPRVQPGRRKTQHERLLYLLETDHLWVAFDVLPECLLV
jgi:hypothetical protein